MRTHRKTRSIRFVLTMWYTLILLLAFVIFGAAVYVYLARLQERALQADLLEEVDWIARLVDVERTRMGGATDLAALSTDVERRITAHFVFNPRNYVVILASWSGRMLYQSDNRRNRDLSGGDLPTQVTRTYTLKDADGTIMRVAARRDAPFLIRVAYTEAIGEEVLKHLLSIFALLAPVVLIVAFSGGWLMAGFVLRPIREIAERTKSITATNLSGRIVTRRTNDELSELISTINDMIARLERSFQNIRDFSLSIAHELKTPLTILKGEAEVALSRPMSPADAEELASSYLEEASRLSRIVDDLLTLARGEAGELTLNTEKVKLDELVSEVYEDALILASGKEISVTLDRNDPSEVTGDPIRLRQLLRALVSNACRYTDKSGAIHIRNERSQKEVAISIADTGIGIEPENLERIFDRFYRSDEARSRAHSGSGLGLPIAKWIADAHHGSINVESTPGKGSVFVLHLSL